MSAVINIYKGQRQFIDFKKYRRYRKRSKMKYLTKEWLIQYKLSYINSVTKKSKQAQTQDIVYYNNLYRNRNLKFVEIEKSDEIYSDPRKDLELCEQRMNK